MNYIEAIKSYVPYNKQEEKDKSIIIKYLNEFDNILTRENETAHFTSSAFILNKNKDKILMIYHNLYNSWGWVGGHADGDSDLLFVAIKESKEETGIKNVNIISNDIFGIDILPVFGHFKNGKYISSHLHLNVVYLLEADETIEEIKIKEDENSGVKWVKLDEVVNHSNENHMKVVYEKIILKIKETYKIN